MKRETVVRDPIPSIHWGFLKQQRRWLQAHEDCDEADGLLQLVIAIQRFAVAKLGVPESEVFDPGERH